MYGVAAFPSYSSAIVSSVLRIEYHNEYDLGAGNL